MTSPLICAQRQLIKAELHLHAANALTRDPQLDAFIRDVDQLRREMEQKYGAAGVFTQLIRSNPHHNPGSSLNISSHSNPMMSITSVFIPVSEPLARAADIDPREVAKATGPEITALVLDVPFEIFFTPFGQFLFRLLSGIIFLLTGAFVRAIDAESRRDLIQMGTHYLERCVDFRLDEWMGKLRELVEGIKALDIEKVKTALVYTPAELEAIKATMLEHLAAIIPPIVPAGEKKEQSGEKVAGEAAGEQTLEKLSPTSTEPCAPCGSELYKQIAGII